MKQSRILMAAVRAAALSVAFISAALPGSARMMDGAYPSSNDIVSTSAAVPGTPDAGTKYVDFKGTWDGKDYRLSNYVGKGKYVLVDFWASWCGPCREEIPNIISTYNKYKSKGLEVVGVAVSDNPIATAEAAKELKINYTVFNEVEKSAIEAYGLTSIPFIILIGPDGTIVATDLRGEEIESTVGKYLSK